MAIFLLFYTDSLSKQAEPVPVSVESILSWKSWSKKTLKTPCLWHKLHIEQNFTQNKKQEVQGGNWRDVYFPFLFWQS